MECCKISAPIILILRHALQRRTSEVDFSNLWSEEARKRLMPGLRVLATKFNGIEGLIPLHGGLPPASAFPITALQLTLKDGTKVDIKNEDEAISCSEYKYMLDGLKELSEIDSIAIRPTKLTQH